MKFRIDLFVKGLAMGAADVVPGVSGGTIAFISGIYDTLLTSIKSIGPEAVRVWRRSGWKAFWRHINGWFLLPLLLGIGTSIVSLAKLISYLLKTYPSLLWAFFCGLIVASVWLVGKEIQRWTAATVVWLLIGTVVAYAITVAAPATGTDAPWFVFVSGMIAICAMILPGISGSFLLVLMGMYGTIIAAITDRNLLIIGVFSAGALLGILSFARLLSWLLQRHRGLTLALLTGFMIGSLNKVWPWKHTVSFYTNRHGEAVPLLQENVLPATYTLQTGEPAYLVPALLLFVLGAIVVVGLERWGNSSGGEATSR
ncbi:MAG: DUF368 domain-containing protein [Bernardetiaceae bacterium]